jgi:hypothetical protein
VGFFLSRSFQASARRIVANMWADYVTPSIKLPRYPAPPLARLSHTYLFYQSHHLLHHFDPQKLNLKYNPEYQTTLRMASRIPTSTSVTESAVIKLHSFPSFWSALSKSEAVHGTSPDTEIVKWTFKDGTELEVKLEAHSVCLHLSP